MYVRSESFSYLSSSHYSTLVGESEESVSNVPKTSEKIHWGEVTNETLRLSFPLLHLIYGGVNRKDDTIVVGGLNGVIESGVDSDTCGWDDLPCRTVAFGVEKLPSTRVTEASLFTISLYI